MKQYLENVLAPREEILLTLGQHWFLIFQESLVAIIVMIAIIAMQWLVASLQPDWPSWLIYSLLLIPLFSIVRTFLKWRSVRVALTNRRVLRLSGILEKHIGEISLGMVDSIQISQGPVERWMGFGDIIFFFKESGESVTFFKMNHPQTFAEALDSLPQMRDNKSSTEKPQVSDITQHLRELTKLYQNGMISEQEYRNKKHNLLKHL